MTDRQGYLNTAAFLDIYCRCVSAALAPRSVFYEGLTRLPQETGFERIPRRSENAVICIAEFLDRVVLVGHNPTVVFATTASHVEHLRKKDDGHYDRDELMSLVEAGHAVLYNEDIVRDILEALPYIVFGCPPRV